MFVNNFALPWANIKKNKYQYEYLLSSSKNREYYERQKISSQISKDEYIFALNYDRVEKRGNNFVYQKFDGEVLKEQLIASSFSWDSDRKSTRLNSSHVDISYAVYCLKKKK